MSVLISNQSSKAEALRGLLTPSCVLSAFFIYYFAWIFYSLTWHPLARHPGPLLARISRAWLVCHAYRGDSKKAELALHRRYGDIVRVAPDEISISDPEAVKIIYGIKGDFVKTDFYSAFGEPNKGIAKHMDYFTMLDEKEHAQRRRIVSSIYQMSSVVESEGCIDACSDLWMKRMGEFAQSGEVFDLGKWLHMYAFDAIGELFLGKMFGFMESREDYGDYMKNTHAIYPLITRLAVMPSYMRLFAVLIALPMKTVRDAFAAGDSIKAASFACVERRQKDMAAGKVVRRDFLARLFKICHERGKELDYTPANITQEVFTAIAAGSDTTAIAMRSIIYYLLKYPSTLRKLVSEINTATATGALSTPYISYAEAITLPYLTACVKEGFRMHPSVGMRLPRHIPSSGATIAGSYFRPGTRVGINPAVLHFDKRAFGDDADVWRPERWLEGQGSRAQEMDRYMLHFGSGSRTCLGKNVSLVEIYKLIPLFLREFEIEFVGVGKGAGEKAEVTWETRNTFFNQQFGLKVKLRRLGEAGVERG